MRERTRSSASLSLARSSERGEPVTVRVDKPAPPVTATCGGGGRDWVELLKAGNDIEAHLVSGRLTEAGVEARKVYDRSGPGAWMYGGSNPWAPVTILVRRVQLEEAKIVLAEISWTAPSYNAARPQPPPEEIGRRRALLWWAAALVLGTLFTSIGLTRVVEGPGGCNVPVLCGGPSSTTP
jgi:Putative prokaryotic signal transducing protein